MENISSIAKSREDAIIKILFQSSCQWHKAKEFRIAKLGTRPKGGSPKDNCEFKESSAQ
jgi:hypothetical protein